LKVSVNSNRKSFMAGKIPRIDSFLP
jgi:hypothetical protein